MDHASVIDAPIVFVAPAAPYPSKIQTLLHRIFPTYPVQWMQYGAEVITAMTGATPACVVTADALPDMDVTTLVRRVRVSQPFLAIVVLTTSPTLGLYIVAASISCAAVLSIPCPPLRVCAVTRALLDEGPTVYHQHG